MKSFCFLHELVILKFTIINIFLTFLSFLFFYLFFFLLHLCCDFKTWVAWHKLFTENAESLLQDNKDDGQKLLWVNRYH